MPVEILNEEGEGRAKQADKLLRLCIGLELFHNADGEPFVTWQDGRARKTARLRSSAFTSWLRWRAHKELELTPSANGVQEALGVLEGRAVHDGKLIQVHRRVAEHDGKTYLDLCNDRWQAVEVDADGWRIIDEPPVRFIRGTGMLSLPAPVAGDVADLRGFLNVVDDADFDVCLAWLLGALQPTGPYPVLALSGRQGSAKSTAARLLGSLIDPNKAPLRSEPKSEDDLIVAAQHSRLVCFDNVSHLSPSMSDALCRLATGGGAAKRKLYTDDEAVILDVQCPVILTGIGSYITRGDLADRALPVSLRPLRDGDYRPERELQAAWNDARPGILGGLLDALACSIRRRGDVRGTSRMADFDAAVEAAGPALGWQPGYFNRLLAGVRDKSRRAHVEDDELAQALIGLSKSAWAGPTGKLHAELAMRSTAGRWLPKSARALGNAIRRIEPLLENVGVVITRRARADGVNIALEYLPGRNVHNVHYVHNPAPELDSGDERTVNVQTPDVQRSSNVHPREAPDSGAAERSERSERRNRNDSSNDPDAFFEAAGDLVDELLETKE